MYNVDRARTYADLCIAVLGACCCSDTRRPAVLGGGVRTCPQPLLCSSSARDGARAPGAPAAESSIDCKEMLTRLQNGRVVSFVLIFLYMHFFEICYNNLDFNQHLQFYLNLFTNTQNMNFYFDNILLKAIF